MWITRFCAGLLLAAVAASAFAFERPFPPKAMRGKLVIGVTPEITIDGQPRRLAAGSRIFNVQNLIQVPSSYPAGVEMVVNYTENIQGDVDRVWILSEKEAAQTPAEQKITEKSKQ